jgi:hypothetical protein
MPAMSQPQKTGKKGPTPEFRAQAGKGRPKGVPNKATKAVKEMVIQALNEAHDGGGVEYLKEQAQKNPTAFLTLVGKVLPLDVNANVGLVNGLLPASIDDLA